MPNKTIYVREADQDLWAEAEEAAGGSLSAFLAEALRGHLAAHRRRKELEDEMQQQVIDMTDGERYWKVGFQGRWLVYPNDDARTDIDVWDASLQWGVALTGRGKIAVYAWDNNERHPSTLEVYDSLKDAEADAPGDILAMAAAELGDDYIQELDI